MEFRIYFSYKDAPVNSEKRQDYELKVESSFDDTAAEFVSGILEHFNEQFTEMKNNAKYLKLEDKPAKVTRENGK